MANGNFLGGVAEGIEGARKLGILEQEQGLKERTLQNTMSRQQLEDADKAVAMGMKFITDSVDSMRKGGYDQEKISSLMMKVIPSLANTIEKSGRDPANFLNMAQAALAGPSLAQQETAAGFGAGTKRLAESSMIERSGISVERAQETSGIKPESNVVLRNFRLPDGTNISARADDPKALNSILSRGGIESSPAQGAMGIGLDPGKAIEVENKLRDDYLKQSAPFIAVRDAWARVQHIPEVKPGEKGAGAADVALLYNFIKILDPGSVVREGEIALSQQAAGYVGTVLNLYNRVKEGDLLTPDLRKSIRDQVNYLYKSQSSQQEKLVSQFSDIAKRTGVNPSNVIVDTSPVTQQKKDGALGIPKPPPGFNLVQ